MAKSKTVPAVKSENSAAKAYAEAAAAETQPAKTKPLVDSLKADAAENTTAQAAKKAPAKKVAPKTSTPAKVAAKPVAAKKKAPAKKVPAKKAPVKKIAAAKTAPKKVVAKKTARVKPAAKKATLTKSSAKPAKATPATKSKSTVIQLKEKIMATQTTDYTAAVTDTMTGAVNEMQTRAQSAYDKSTEAMTEITDFAKGNVEAVVESGKLLAEGVQSMGETYATQAKTAYETATADIQEMASIKSPTDLFQLQGKILRRNFDAMISATSKSTDAAMKLANDAAAPISGRVSVATDKLSKVA